MEPIQPQQRCDNCSQLFPESKINSHFSYCRRNIKRCRQCQMMVDVNYQEEHNLEFHVLTPCKFCKVELKKDDLVRHEDSCKARPKYCEFCQLNIAVGEYDRHVVTCGSRTNKCPKCEKHVMLKEFAVHEVSCRGKVVEVPQTVINDAFKKREVREIREGRLEEVPMRQERIEARGYQPQQPEMRGYQHNEPRAYHQQPEQPTHGYRIPVNPQKSSLKEEIPKKGIETNQRFNNMSNQRFTSRDKEMEWQKTKELELREKERRELQRQQAQRQQAQRQQDQRQQAQRQQDQRQQAQRRMEREKERNKRTTNLIEQPRPARKEEYKHSAPQEPIRGYKHPTHHDPTRRREQPRQQVPVRRDDTAFDKLYRQQREVVRKTQKQTLLKKQEQQHRIPRPYQPQQPFHPQPSQFDMSNEDMQLQKALMESASVQKNQGFEDLDFNSLGIQDMSQSFYRDVQRQQEIESNLKKGNRRL